MHAREVRSETNGLTYPKEREGLTIEPNELELVMEWVVEGREGTKHAQSWWWSSNQTKMVGEP